MKQEFMFKIVSVFVLAVLLSMPFFVADVYAINFVPFPSGETVKVTGATTDVEGYVRDGDTLVMEVIVDDDSEVFKDQVRMSSDFEFTRCEPNGLTSYKCYFEFPSYRIAAAQDFALYLFEKAGSYDVPTTCSSVTCSASKKCKECATGQIKTDSHDPSSGTFSVVQDGTPEITFSATDAETGIKTVEVYVAGVSSPVAVKDFEKDPTTGTYPISVTDSVSIANLAEGTYNFIVRFYDGLGNVLIKSRSNQHIDRSPPVILGWYINSKQQTGCFENPGLDVIKKNDISQTGISSSDVCVYVEFDNGGNFPADAEMTIRNLNTEHPNVGFESSAIHCSSNYCMFGTYASGDPLALYLTQPGGTTVSADVSIRDQSGNEAMKTLSKGIQRIDTPPTITSFTTSGFYEGVNYLGSDSATVELNFNSVVDIDPRYVRLDASELKTGATSLEPDFCNAQKCVWTITGATSTTSGNIYLKGIGSSGPEDQFGNAFLPFEMRTLYFVMDTERPILNTISLKNIDSSDSWSNDCVDRDPMDYENPVGGTSLLDDDGTGFCKNCSYDNPVAMFSTVDAYCDAEHFWRPFSDSAYFTEGGYFDLQVTFSDGVAGNRAFINVSNIINNGGLVEGTCSDVGTEMECTWSSKGSLKEIVYPADSFDLIVTDVAGNMNRYKIPISNYKRSARNVDFWHPELVSSSPDKLDTQLMSIYGLSQLHVLNYACTSDCGGAEIIDVDVSCEPVDSDMAGLIDTATAFWHNSNVYLRLGYSSLDVTSDDIIDINCTIKTTTSVSNVAFGPEVDYVTIPVTFFNSPIGTIDDSIEKLILDAAAPWNNSVGIARLVKPLEQFFNFFRNLCGVTKTLHSIYDYIAGVNDLLKALGWVDGGASQAATASANAGFKGTIDVLAKWETTICKALTCEYCQTAIKNPSSMFGGSGDDLAKKAEANRKEFDNVRLGYATDEHLLDAGADIASCFASFYGGDSDEKGDGWGMKDGLDPADLCVPMGWAICLFQENSVVKLLNNPLQYAASADFMNKYVPPEARPVSNSPEESLVMSSLTMCVPGITHNLNKLRQIDCRYIKCLRDEVANGNSTVAECENLRNYATCQFVVGEGWSIMPLSGLFDTIGNILEDLIFNPLTWIKYAPGAACYAICAVNAFPPGSCTGCHLTMEFMKGIDTLVAYGIKLSEMADNGATFEDYASMFGWQSTVNECDGVIENEFSITGDGDSDDE